MNKILKISGLLLLFLGIALPFFTFTKYKIEKAYEVKKTEEIIARHDYYALLEIDKIDLKKELYEIDDSKNNVNRNILLHQKSVLPGDSPKSNIILAAHSGNGSEAYFKDLYLLELGDVGKFYYQDKIWIYEIQDIEYQDKTGVLYLKEDFKEMITLITCTKGNKNKQTIYYGALKECQNV